MWFIHLLILCSSLMSYAISSFTYALQLFGLSGFSILRHACVFILSLCHLLILALLVYFAEHALLSMLFKALYYPGFDLHRLPFRLLALTVFVAWFGHSPLPYHVFVMLTHVQTLLNQSYRFSWAMVQYVLF